MARIYKLLSSIPCLNPSSYTHYNEKADMLIDIMTKLELDLLLPLGTITYSHVDTIIDLLWANDKAISHILKC